MSSIQCKFCSSPLPLNSLVCTHCKQRNPISPLYHNDKSLDRPEEIICVECHTNSMEYVDLGDIHETLLSLQCSECRGIFISFELFEKAIMHYGLKRKKIPNKIETPKEKKRNADNLYPCPICSQTMKRALYKISSGIIIDKCEKHGVWLNHGELRELIEWKQSQKNFRDREAEEEAYRKYGLKKRKSPYTYQRDTSTNTERFFEWLMGV